MVELGHHNKSLMENEEKLVQENKEAAMKIVDNEIELKKLADRLSFLEKTHQQVTEELKNTQEEKQGMQRDLIELREAQADAEVGQKEMMIEVADLLERLDLKQIELDTKTELLTDAREKVVGFDQIMHELHENEKQIRYEAELMGEKLKNSQALNISHKDKNAMLENNLKEALRKYNAMKNKQSDQQMAMEMLEKRTEDQLTTAEQHQQRAERDARFYEYEYTQEQKKVTKLEERILQSRQTIT